MSPSMTCQDVRARVYPYLDHLSMDPGERQTVERHLEACDPCRRHYAATDRIDRAIRESTRSVAPPAELEARVLARLGRRGPPVTAALIRQVLASGWGWLAAACLLVALGLGILWPIVTRPEPNGAEDRIAFGDVARWVVNFHDDMGEADPASLDMVSSQPRSVEEFLSARLRFHCCVPDLATCGVELVGGSVKSMGCCASPPPMAYVRYRRNGDGITHIDVPASGVEMDPEFRVREAGRELYVFSETETCVVAVVFDRTICLFVADRLGREGTIALALAALQ